MNPARDILLTFAPPERLRKWLRATWDARTAKGDTVPPEFERWLERVTKLIDGLPTEADTMTDDEVAELWSLIPTQIVMTELTKQPKQAMLDAQIVTKRGAY